MLLSLLLALGTQDVAPAESIRRLGDDRRGLGLDGVVDRRRGVRRGLAAAQREAGDQGQGDAGTQFS